MGHGEESPMTAVAPLGETPRPHCLPNAQCPKSGGGYPSPRHLRDGVSRRLSMKLVLCVNFVNASKTNHI
ncbi:hypothetical protein [Nostoc sp. CHAB 5715]|uniref:hypothetical protein n=1 Tax=Nostoc sp. CHAB 5715 TaxID=2780400 RepID=UPI001E62BDD0|nr:hypothetical protein [Nostoc sp. CHAB 5715]MCC5626021.1 hypothetical protein [Nostoc sp. CHAB 5715]